MCNNIKYKRKQFMKNVNKKSWINAVIICVMAIFLVWYTSSAYSNIDDTISHTETIADDTAASREADNKTADEKTVDEKTADGKTTTGKNAEDINVVSDVTDLTETFDTILTYATKTTCKGCSIDESFLLWLDARYGDAAIIDIAYELSHGNSKPEVWYDNTGASIRVLWLRYCRDLGFSTYTLENVVWMNEMDAAETDTDRNAITGNATDTTTDKTANKTTDTATDKTANESSDKTIKIDLVGDINLADDWYTMDAATQRGGVSDCISENAQSELASADISVVNNEFVYEDGETPLAGKTYTFGAATENVKLLKIFSADLVTLANNHVYDYGEEGLISTLDTLDGAEIPYVGAGRNLEEASAIKYFVVKGRKIAFVSATEIEKFAKYTKEATENSPGVIKTIDTSLFCSVIAEAKANADYVVACVHWGIEGKNDFEAEQRRMAEDYVKAGADVVIGGHPHRLQGVEFIEDTPVAYSLGNFWFSTGTIYTTIAQIRIDGSGELSLYMIPCIQQNLTTSILTEEAEIDDFYKYVADVSYGVGIDADGKFYNSFKVIKDESVNEKTNSDYSNAGKLNYSNAADKIMTESNITESNITDDNITEDIFKYRSGTAYAVHSDLVDLEGRPIDIVGNLQ